MNTPNVTEVPSNRRIASDTAAGWKDASQVVMEFWRQSGVRMMRSSENFARGMIPISQSEIEIGQQLLIHRLAPFHSGLSAALQSHWQDQITRNIKEFESATQGVRRISHEFREVLGKSVKLLFREDKVPASGIAGNDLQHHAPFEPQTTAHPTRVQV